MEPRVLSSDIDFPAILCYPLQFRNFRKRVLVDVERLVRAYVLRKTPDTNDVDRQLSVVPDPCLCQRVVCRQVVQLGVYDGLRYAEINYLICRIRL